jgi:hypothetical protein
MNVQIENFDRANTVNLSTTEFVHHCVHHCMSVDRRFSDMSFALSLPRAEEGQAGNYPLYFARPLQ